MLQVEQTRHEFAFGSAIQADLISGTDARALGYQTVFYNMFEWAVIENALKWRQMEWNRVRKMKDVYVGKVGRIFDV